jgi:hypothetical protein
MKVYRFPVEERKVGHVVLTELTREILAISTDTQHASETETPAAYCIDYLPYNNTGEVAAWPRRHCLCPFILHGISKRHQCSLVIGHWPDDKLYRTGFGIKPPSQLFS